MITELQIIKTMNHYFEEKASYHPQNFDAVIKAFSEIKNYKNKRISAIVMSKEVCLIKQNEMESLPRIANETCVIFNTELKEECFNIAARLYEGIVRDIINGKEAVLEEILESPGSKMERKQEQFNYVRAIRKKMQTCHKIFRDTRMEEYDFREIELDGAIFINCSLKNANFSHVNLENVMFINCDLTGALFYKSQMNGSMVINGVMQELDKEQRSVAQNV